MYATHIPRVYNTSAHALTGVPSLKLPVRNIWSTNSGCCQGGSALRILRLSEPQVVLFATRAVARLPVLCSLARGEGKLAQDAMTLSWGGGFKGYAFPPTPLLRVILS